MMQLATTTMLRDANIDIVRSFVSYHRAIGFDHMFLIFDVADDPAFAEANTLPGVTCLEPGPALLAEQRANREYARHEPWLDRVYARQCLNTAVAIGRARAMGITWLMHIDVDELVHVPGHDARVVFAAIPETSQLAIALNDEAIPEAEHVENYFREVTLFKRNPRRFTAAADWRDSFWSRRGWFFNGYTNGKSAVRVAVDPTTDGAHRFLSSERNGLRTTILADATLLHYQNCSLDRYLQKYRTRGHFAQTYFDGSSMRDRFPFHFNSRDLIVDDKVAEAAAYYRANVMMREVELEGEIERGHLFRVSIPPALFG
jgi:hypothetical protein